MDRYPILAEIFSNKSKEVIENIIRIVEESNQGYTSEDEKLEVIVNLLTESGSIDENPPINPVVPNNYLLDEAAAFAIANVAEDIVSITLNRLMDIFPNADPTYLEDNALKLAHNEIELETFITNNIENEEYPTMEDYLRKKNEQSENEKYLSRFKLYPFLLEFPDPIEHFKNNNRNHAFKNCDSSTVVEMEKDFVLKCLCNQFTYLRESDVRKVFKMCHYNVVNTYYKLITIPRAFKTPRAKMTIPDISIHNVALLQEIAFIQHEKEFVLMKQEKETNLRNARNMGLLETCSCCFAEDLIPEDCYLCRKGCKFCKDCIRRAAEIAYADGKTEFVCISNCGSDYSLTTLQMVLNPKTFTNLCHNIQMREVTTANIPGIEHCPLCSNFAMIPDPSDKLFHCENCNKDSCRECKHESHLPLRCNEIEYDEDVRMRTYIENKMTEALLRKCHKCGKTFIKNTGCNKITCSCGAIMCYLCGAKVADYTHFKNDGCPLFTNDDEIHLNDVMKGANTAKAELGVDANPGILKFDPTKGFSDTI